MKDTALDLSLEALEKLKRAFFKRASTAEEIEQGCDRGYEDYEAEFVEPALKAITAIKQARSAPVQPADGTQVSKVWWDGEKLMAKPIPLEDFYQPVHEPVAQSLKDAVFTVIEGFNIPHDVRKILESAYYNAPPAAQRRIEELEAQLMQMQGREIKLQMALNTPAAQRQWVGLTDEEMNDITCGMVKGWVMERLAIAIEAKLKEKNT